MRLEGIDTRRTSLGGEWRLPFSGAIGDQYALAVGLRGDGYVSDNLPTAAGGLQSATTGRIFPQVALTWRYPWVRPGRCSQASCVQPGGLASAPRPP